MKLSRSSTNPGLSSPGTLFKPRKRSRRILLKIQKRVALGGLLFCGIAGTGDFLYLLLSRESPLMEILFHQGVVLPFAGGAIFLLTALFTTRAFRFLQVFLFMISGIIGYAYSVSPGILSGPVLFVYGILLALQYGFLDKHGIVTSTVLLILYSAAVLTVCLIKPSHEIYLGIMDILVTIFLLYLFLVVFADELAAHARASRLLQKKLEDNQLFIHFGKHITGLVHNIKNKLMSINGINEILTVHLGDDNQGDKGKELLRHQSRAITQMISLSDSLLFSARSFGEEDAHVTALDRILRGILEIHRADTHFKREITLESSLNQAYCVVSPRDIIIMVENIIDNALEAMEGKRKKELRVDTDMDTINAYITVTDTGGGIPFCTPACPEKSCISCGHIHYGNTTKPGGHGIGMSAVKETLLELRGDLKIDNFPGEGASVTLVIPRKRTA